MSDVNETDLLEILIGTELGGIVNRQYQVSFAVPDDLLGRTNGGNKSGFSFGAVQLDIGNNDFAIAAYASIINTALSNNIISESQHQQFAKYNGVQRPDLIDGLRNTYSADRKYLTDNVFNQQFAKDIIDANSAQYIKLTLLPTVKNFLDAIEAKWGTNTVFDPSHSDYHDAVAAITSISNRTGGLAGSTAYFLNSSNRVDSLSDVKARYDAVLGDHWNLVLMGGERFEDVDESPPPNLGGNVSHGTNSADFILGTVNNDTLMGYDGNDTLVGGRGNDNLYGGRDNDKLWGYEGDDLIYGEDGNDTLYGYDGYDTLFGGWGNDTLYGGRGNDRLIGSQGNDYIDGEEGNDNLSGGDGNDTLQGGKGWYDDTLYGGRGDDELWGGEGNDRLFGQDGNDYLYADEGNDYLNGGEGSDTLVGANGNDTMYGGSGNGADRLYGGNGNDELWGYGGNDVLYGGNGTDKLYGYHGNDTLVGGWGNDSLYGGHNNDQLWGYENNDYLNGEQGNDTLYGYHGNDTLVGHDGEDVLYGGYGQDELTGGNGLDYLYGEQGNDTLDGGAGDNILNGGSGQDNFIFRTIDNSRNIIDDFDSGWDQLDFANVRRQDGTFVANGNAADTNNDNKITTDDWGWDNWGNDGLVFYGQNGANLYIDLVGSTHELKVYDIL